ncbi:hypothetical protein [Dyella agri]|uniref:Secreted protein n=1 Tax=Dyella agri TaxID=1926869 RepID=A0ABW8KJE0_9GAMM
MSARHWMIGCLIGLAGMGSAMAADMDTRDVTTSSHSSTADTSAHDAGSSNGDTLSLNRDCPPSRHSADTDSSDSESHGSGAGGGSEHGGRISAPTSARPATLGWQSLLPGSIQ